MIAIEFKATGFNQVQSLLSRVDGRVKNLAPLFRGKIDPDVSVFFRRQFDTRGLEGMRPWAPLKPATIRWRQGPRFTTDKNGRRRRTNRKSRVGGNRGGVTHPLWDTGALRGSLIKVGPRSIRIIERTRYARGTSDARAKYHQRGWGVPQRMIVPDRIPHTYTNRWGGWLAEYMLEGEGSHGGS